MKLLFFIIFLNYSIHLVAQQSTDIEFFKKVIFEKAILSKYSIKSKTSSLPTFDLDQVIKEEKVKTYERNLTQKEICKLFKNINYMEQTHILDNNYDIEIIFLNKNNKISQKIEISSFSKNIKLKKSNCKTKNEINPCLYQGMLSKKFNNYIKKLLSK